MAKRGTGSKLVAESLKGKGYTVMCTVGTVVSASVPQNASARGISGSF